MRRSCPEPKMLFLLIICVFCLFLLRHQGDPIQRSIYEIPAVLPVAHPTPPFASWVPKPVPECRGNASAMALRSFRQQPANMKNFLRYRHCKEFPRILDVPNKCGGAQASKNVFLLLVIKSSPINYERREIIRKTWGMEKAYQRVQVRRLFIVGISSDLSEAEKINRLLQLETQEYGDILQWNFYDTFYNLSLKQVLFYQWMVETCPDARFIFNGDDDVFVNTYNVVEYLLGLPSTNDIHSHLFVGSLNIGMPPVREVNSKYYVPKQLFSSDAFLPYCGGGGILMSHFTAQAIYKASLDIQLFPIDDAYLGMCLAKAGLSPASHEGIRTLGIWLPSSKFKAFNPCYYKELLMVHRFVPFETLVMWKAIQDPNLNCAQINQMSAQNVQGGM
uniref:Hexosyltransferase n=1 Tax=Geotrypetes seraphini TaxID=260995 RepID=A0A6P8S472_GEOSA|nr:N-acetyllactosaminide beta-1,3-N-acetylglucosaminyltransferase 3-like [Geotrypetes seraphini]XP_033812523.1 N-acetyllactosaminide beta-1,3-N-acetylglucosaminyltransferase 3-like [Geotrypetes seraphini]